MEIIRYRDFEPDYRNLVKAASNQWVAGFPCMNTLSEKR